MVHNGIEYGDMQLIGSLLNCSKLKEITLELINMRGLTYRDPSKLNGSGLRNIETSDLSCLWWSPSDMISVNVKMFLE